MPAILTTPVAVATATGVELRTVTHHVRQGYILIEADFVDANGNAIAPAPPVRMTAAAYQAALVAATGNLLNRDFTIYLAQAGFTASVIT